MVLNSATKRPTMIANGEANHRVNGTPNPLFREIARMGVDTVEGHGKKS
jgi:hypothetical protein